MFSRRTILVHGVSLGLLAAALVAGAFLTYVIYYTQTDRVLPGVHIGQVDVGGLGRREVTERLSGGVSRTLASESLQELSLIAPGADPGEGSSLASGSAPPSPELTLELRAEGRTWLLSRAEAGPVPDLQEAVRAATAVGRKGTPTQRLRAFITGLLHGHHIPVPLRFHEFALRESLEAIAQEVDRAPVDAAYDFSTDTLTPEVDGQELDVAASLELVKKALLLEQPTVELMVLPVAASVRAQELQGARQYQISRFTTPILSADPGRVHNISIAVRKISGTMLRPGQSFSFNEVVGPRDAENGWAQAKEIYQGEFVLGYGGGICQVSSTLYNSVLLAGLEVKERYHHDRPLEYVRPGRDATVAWKVLDFRFRNNLDQPVLIGARVLPGQPQQIEVTLHGASPLRDDFIGIEEADIKYLPAGMVEVLDDKLPEGERVVVDEGHYGIEIKIYRVFGKGAGQRRELVSVDRYQPKPGKVRAGVGNGPGSQRLLDPGMQ